MTSRQATHAAAADLTAAGRRSAAAAQQARAEQVMQTHAAADVDAEHDKALKQFVETPGHFSLVRCVWQCSLRERQRRESVTAHMEEMPYCDAGPL